jgi:hypothetical protein
MIDKKDKMYITLFIVTFFIYFIIFVFMCNLMYDYGHAHGVVETVFKLLPTCLNIGR